MQPVWTLEPDQYGVSPQLVIPQLFLFVDLQGPIISPARASQNRYAPVSPHVVVVDEELLLCLTVVDMAESTTGQVYTRHLLDTPKTRSKRKKKVTDPSQLIESNEQMACLFQRLHNAGVLEDVELDILQDLVM